MTRYVLVGTILVLMFSGAANAQCVPGGLAVVVNKSNPVESLTIGQLRKFLLGDARSWPNHKQVSLVFRDLSSPVYQCMLRTVVGVSPGEYNRYILNVEFRGEEPVSIQTVDSDAAAIRQVSKSPGSLAIIEANSVASLGSTVKVIRLEVRPG